MRGKFAPGGRRLLLSAGANPSDNRCISAGGKFPLVHDYDGAPALELVKKDLKAQNTSVEVDLEEYDEVMPIKPMFLNEGYQ